eukprot:10087592-Alexandrium_andersonii.AAC.1
MPVPGLAEQQGGPVVEPPMEPAPENRGVAIEDPTDSANVSVLPMDEPPSPGTMPEPTPEDLQGATAVGPPT